MESIAMTKYNAIGLTDFGDVEVFKEITLEKPVLKAGELLVKQSAVAIDPYDIKFRAGAFGNHVTFPFVTGSTVVGKVEAIGTNVNVFTVGERVVAVPHQGGYAEYAVVKATETGHVPEGVKNEAAAALALGGQTGYQAIVDGIKLKKGESILIHGGAGAVGNAAIQTALLLGAGKIYTTALPEDLDEIKALDDQIEVIDFTTTKFQAVVSDVDAVLEIIGRENTFGSIQVVKEGGRIISTVPLPVGANEAAQNKNVAIRYYVMQPTTKVLTELMKQLKQGDIITKVVEVKPFNLENLKASHRAVAQQLVHGKIVLSFDK
jgi:NADPH:quinone reductase-like Zn-dependent oxidoreductase